MVRCVTFSINYIARLWSAGLKTSCSFLCDSDGTKELEHIDPIPSDYYNTFSVASNPQTWQQPFERKQRCPCKHNLGAPANLRPARLHSFLNKAPCVAARTVDVMA